jgi:hypothetical protein
MQGPQFDYWKVELCSPNFLARGIFQPRGDMLIFLNNLTYLSFYFKDVQFIPLGAEYQIKGIKQPGMTINRGKIAFMSLLEEERVKNMQLLAAKRPIVCYTEWFAIQGNLHVNSETPDENLFDDKFEFFTLTDVTIYPLRSMNVKPTHKVPALALNRTAILAYHVRPE